MKTNNHMCHDETPFNEELRSKLEEALQAGETSGELVDEAEVYKLFDVK